MDIESFSLPARKRGSYSEKFKPLDILTNYYSVKLGKMDKIHIFSVKFNPQVPADNIPKRLGLLREALPKLNFI